MGRGKCSCRIGVLVAGLTVPLFGQSESVAAQAADLIDDLLEQVGGRDVWAAAQGFHMVEIMYSESLPLPAVREFWVDFERPRIMQRTTTNATLQLQSLDEDSGWTLRDGTLTEWSAETVADWSGFWPGIPTRVFHMMASDDPSLRVERVDGNRLDIYVDGAFAVWIALDDAGVPVAYGREETHTFTHFLGRMEQYGPVRLWTAAYEPGDLWRVTMVDYDLFTESIPVSYEPPEDVASHRPAPVG